MIGQYLQKTNKNITMSKSKNFLELNKAQLNRPAGCTFGLRMHKQVDRSLTSHADAW
jgi:hypothetical protein